MDWLHQLLNSTLGRMMKRLTIWLLTVAILTGCAKAPPTVVLDSWWNTDYAKSVCRTATDWYKQNAALISQVGCSTVTSCKDMMPQVNACMFDSTGGVHDFEISLSTAFAADPACSKVSFVVFSGPQHVTSAESEALKRSHWSLMLDFTPGAKQQDWSLVRLGKQHSFAKGNGHIAEIARQVCAIARNVSASVSN